MDMKRYFCTCILKSFKETGQMHNGYLKILSLRNRGGIHQRQTSVIRGQLIQLIYCLLKPDQKFSQCCQEAKLSI